MGVSVSDVYIDGEVLARVHRNLTGIRDLMERPARQMQDVDGWVMGAPALVRRMDEFGSEWAYGIRKLASFAGDAASALDRVEQAFDDADASLAQALRSAGQQ
jgi:hypothetical protein